MLHFKEKDDTLGPLNAHHMDEEKASVEHEPVDSYRDSKRSPSPTVVVQKFGQVCRRLLLRGTSHPNFRAIFNYEENDGPLRSTAWLDGLRGLAAIDVFFYHTFLFRPGAEAHQGDSGSAPWDIPGRDLPFIRTLWDSGPTCVNLFFAISGFVLTHRMWILVKSQDFSDGKLFRTLSSSVFRRGLRLYLPTFANSFLFMLIVRMGYPRPARMGEPAPSLWSEIERWAWTCISQFLPVVHPANWDRMNNGYDRFVSWTIPYEYYGSMQVYMAVLLLAFVPRLRARLFFVALWAVVAFHKNDWAGAQFLLGMAYADYQVNASPSSATAPTTIKPDTTSLSDVAPTPLLARTAPASGSLLRQIGITTPLADLSAYALFIFGFYLSGLPDRGGSLVRPYFDWISMPDAWYNTHEGGDRILWSLAAMCTLIGCGQSPRLQRILGWGFIQYLGRISFGLYLCHGVVQMGYDPLFGTLDAWTAPYVGQPLTMLFLGAVWLVPLTLVNFVVAGQFQKWIDDPSVRFGRTLEKWFTTMVK